MNTFTTLLLCLAEGGALAFSLVGFAGGDNSEFLVSGLTFVAVRTLRVAFCEMTAR